MRGKKVAVLFLILATIGLVLDFSFVQAQSTLTQFGNLDYNSSWNVEGGVVVASQFSIQQSITVTWMSALVQDSSPSSVFRLGIFSDNNNQPNVCLASTTIVPAQTVLGWYQLPLSNSITLQPGTYWLAEVDSGAGVIKYVENPGNTLTVYTPLIPTFMQELNVGNQLSASLTSLSGTLAIVASFGPPSIPGVLPPPTYAEGAQCWTSGSSSNPYPVQTSFAVGVPVYIYWSPYNPSTGVVDIIVNYPSGTHVGHAICCSFIDLTPENAPVYFVPDEPGTWVITCNGYSTTLTVTQVDVPGNGYVFVTPEYAFGALLSLVACFASLGLFILRHNATRKKIAKL